MRSRGYSSNAILRSGELRGIIEAHIEEESTSLGIIRNNSDRSVRRFRNNNNVAVLTPKAKTAARVQNEGDPGNHYSLYCLLCAFATKTPNQGIYNFDATTFEINLSKQLRKSFKVKRNISA